MANYAPVNVQTLLSAVTSTGAGQWVQLPAGPKSFHGHMTVSSGSGTATVTIEATNSTASGWTAQLLATRTLSDTVDDSATADFPAYLFYRANVTALAGTGAAVTAIAGYAP